MCNICVNKQKINIIRRCYIKRKSLFRLHVPFIRSLTMAVSSALHEHWQVDKSLTECNQFMLENNFYHDVTFTLDYKHMEET